MADDLPPGCVFDFNVCDPKQVRSGMLSHWVYHVYTKTSLEKYPQRKCTAVRRYSDFEWLRKQLVEEYPGCIIPPIPEKTLSGSVEKVTGGTDPSALVEYRQRSMRKFLVRVGAHHMTCMSDVIQDFLVLQDEEFQRRLKQKPKAPFEEELGITGGMSGAKLMMSKAGQESEDYKAWDETTEYLTQFQTSLEALRDKFNLLVAKRKEQAMTTEQFGKAFTKAGEAEEQHEKTPLSSAMCDIGRHTEHMSQVINEWAEQDVMQVVESVTYYIGLCGSAKVNVARLQRLMAGQALVEQNIQTLTAKRDGSPEGEGKTKLTKEIANEDIRLEKIKNANAKFTETFREELTRFHREKAYDMKAVLRAFSELQQEYAGRMRTSWDSILPTVDAIRCG